MKLQVQVNESCSSARLAKGRRGRKWFELVQVKALDTIVLGVRVGTVTGRLKEQGLKVDPTCKEVRWWSFRRHRIQQLCLIELISGSFDGHDANLPNSSGDVAGTDWRSLYSDDYILNMIIADYNETTVLYLRKCPRWIPLLHEVITKPGNKGVCKCPLLFPHHSCSRDRDLPVPVKSCGNSKCPIH